MADRSSLLLLCSLSLWMLQTAMPVFPALLPPIRLSWRHTPVAIPSNHALCFLAGLLCHVAMFFLLHARSGGRISLKANVFFLVFGLMVNYGHGMHLMCVMVQEKGESMMTQPLAAFVDFLHEVVSHYLFTGGIYGLIMTIMKAERDSLDYKLHKKTDGKNGTSKAVFGLNKGTASIGETFLVHWMWPTIVGAYFSIFSAMTHTVPLTVVFYLLVCACAIRTGKQLELEGSTTLLGLMEGELLVCGTITKAACVGLPAMGLWLYMYT